MGGGGWHLVVIHSVPGLTDVGVSPDSRSVLALGDHGRELVDARTGVREARDVDPDGTWFDPPSRHALGIGRLDRVWVPVAGLGGGVLPIATDDGWRATRTADGARLDLVPGAGVVGAAGVDVTDAADGTRAFGFSPDGRVFVHATPSGVLLLRRGPRPRLS